MVGMTKVEIHVMGLRRSGNHSIIHWIISQCPGSIYFLKDMPLFKVPALCGTHVTVATNKYVQLIQKISLKKLEVNKNAPFWRNALKRAKEKVLTLAFYILKKDYLIYSYEDRSLKDIFDAKEQRIRNRLSGGSPLKYEILILRDPFNLIASRLKRIENRKKLNIKGLGSQESLKGLVGLWKDYAKEYLGYTNYLKNNKVIINYNKWCVDKDYRENIAKRLGVPFSDKAINDVPADGGGSSFDGQSLQGKAQEMQVMERWKHYAGNKIYEDILCDKELVDLSDKIFGKIR